MSTPPWRGLNLALHVGDDPDAVAANRAELASRLGAGALSFPEQTHGAGVHILTAGGPVPSPRGVPGVDALVTAVPRVPLGVLVADCVPVLFADPVARVIAVAHAGRRGLVAGVLGATVDAMSRLGADPARMTAVIGPAVCGRCYEVPGGLQAAVAAAIPGTETTTRAGTPALDLPAGARSILSRLGVAAVRTVEACTVEDDRFYSYRRDGETGRFAGVVMLAGDD